MQVNSGYPYIRPFPGGSTPPTEGAEVYVYIEGQFLPGICYVFRNGRFFPVNEIIPGGFLTTN